VCRVPRLPLRPGKYGLRFVATVKGVLADFIEDAGVLHVSEGDYFGTGRLPPPAGGAFLVQHSFEIEPGPK
jgi:lipopolysaccharide transport system ATP-binding protein